MVNQFLSMTSETLRKLGKLRKILHVIYQKQADMNFKWFRELCENMLTNVFICFDRSIMIGHRMIQKVLKHVFD